MTGYLKVSPILTCLKKWKIKYLFFFPQKRFLFSFLWFSMNCVCFILSHAAMDWSCGQQNFISSKVCPCSPHWYFCSYGFELFLHVYIMVLIVVLEEEECVCVLSVRLLLTETSVTQGTGILAPFPLKKTQSDLRSAHLLQGPDCVRRPEKKQMQFNCVGCLVTSSQIFYLFWEVQQWRWVLCAFRERQTWLTVELRSRHHYLGFCQTNKLIEVSITSGKTKGLRNLERRRLDHESCYISFFNTCIWEADGSTQYELHVSNFKII